ncbi:hypothetical protein PG988_013450 [Apiospora saccharicola]
MAQDRLSRIARMGCGDKYTQEMLLKETSLVREELKSAVDGTWDGKSEIKDLALSLSRATELSAGIIERLQEEIRQLKQDKADLQLGSRRFICFGRLPPRSGR